MTSVAEAPVVVGVDGLIAALLREVDHRTPDAVHPCLRGGAVVVGVPTRGIGGAAVAAAVDEDGNTGRIITYAADAAHRLHAPLRVVHVWTGRTATSGVLMAQHDSMSDADRLLSTIVYDHLPAEEVAATERAILHDDDPGRALVGLSARTSLMVIAARSGPGTTRDPLGATVRALLGRTACPLAVLPAVEGPERMASARW
jgi:hypothetical protein